MTVASDQARVISIDLNSDLGEGYGVWAMGDDNSILRTVTSANIACGYHAGDASIMRRTCEKAVENRVQIGAHVSYKDLAGFGRRDMDVPVKEITNDVIYQIGALAACAKAAGGAVAYVKPHGALYNRIVWDAECAAAVVEAILLYDRDLAAVGLPQSRFLSLAATAGLRTIPEGFADRAYDSDGRLVPRSRSGSVIHDAGQVAERAIQMAVDGSVRAITGETVRPAPRSLCIHGDTPGAAALALKIRTSLEAAGVRLAAFR